MMNSGGRRPWKRYFEHSTEREDRPQNEFDKSEPDYDSVNNVADKTSATGTGEHDAVPYDLMLYLRGLAKTADEGVILEEALLQKCLEECASHLVDLLSTVDSSRCLQCVFTTNTASAELFLRRLLTVKHKKIAELLCGGCSSRTIEALLQKLAEDGVVSEQHLPIFADLTSLIVQDWMLFCLDQNASHVVRTLGSLYCDPSSITAQSPTPKLIKMEKKNEVFSGNPPLKLCYEQLATRVLDWTLIKDNHDSEAFSLLAQDFIQFDAKSKSHTLERLIEAAVEDNDPRHLVDQWKSRQGSRIWEQLLKCCSDSDAERIHQAIALSGDLVFRELAKDQFSNYPLQRLIERAVSSEEMMGDLVDKLQDNLTAVTEIGNYGVICSLSKALLKFEAKQGNFVKALATCFGCEEKSDSCEFLRRLLTLRRDREKKSKAVKSTRDNEQNNGDFQFDTTQLKLQGSVLVQNLLRLRRCKRISGAVCALSPQCLLSVCCHVNGCHVVDAFFASATVTDDKKQKALDKLKANMLTLVCDKYGSRVFDGIWRNLLTTKQKCKLIEQLAPELQQLHSSHIGRIIARKYRIDIFKQSVKRWRNEMAQNDKKISTFKSFLTNVT